MNKGNDVNVGSTEEDIGTLNSIVKVNKDFLSDIENQTINQKEIKALEHLLQDYTRQKEMNEEHQKINGELRERIQKLEEKLLDMINGTEIINKETPEYIKENYIPKQVVIDKIKEYDKKMEEDAGHPNWVVTDRIVMNVLQELLEGEK